MGQKRLVYSHWCFFKAGQGCFYSGQVMTRKSRPYTFVYDCGSQSPAILKKEIRDFKTYLNRRPDGIIDLLVLSHLDADHINQVDYLLKDCACKTVVLPYLVPAERLFLYFSIGFDDATDDDTYREFVTDPAAFLIVRGAERVIFITGNDENGTLNPEIPGPGFPVDENKSREQFEEGDLFAEDILLTEDDQADADEQLAFQQANPKKVEFRKANGGIRAGEYWEFFFYQIAQTPASILDFRDQLIHRFGVTFDRGHMSVESLKDIFKQQAKVDQLKKIFKSLFKETNSTGLIVLHGPINQYHSRFASNGSSTPEPVCYTMLSGDTDMNHHYPAYINYRVPFVRVFQVPHHGSAKNWDEAKLADLEDCNMVINYGTTNGYGHPGPSVRAAVLALYPMWTLRENTELSAYCYQVYAYYAATGSRREIAPLGGSHSPVITTTEFRTIDDQENFGRWTDARALSLGRAQWDRDEFSVKAWRTVNGHWSRQSEEVPLHRALDMALMVISGMIEQKTNVLPGHHLELEVMQPQELNDLRDFIKDRSGLLEERVRELLLLIEQYLDL